MAYTKSNTTNVSFTSTSTSQVLSTKAKEVVLSATQDCYISFDSTTAAAVNGFFVAKDKQYIIHILFPAQISAIRKSTDGVLSVLELGDSIKELRVTYSDTLTSDTNLKKTVISSYTGDSAIVTLYEDSFTGDASLLKEITSLTFTSDASLKRIVATDYTGDANLKGEVSSSYTSDSNLTGEVAATFTGDSAVMTLCESTFTGDASLKSVVADSFTGDANMLETIHPLCFNGDAKLVTF